MLKKAVIITKTGYQDHELLYPYYRVQEDGFSVDIAADQTGEIQGILGTKITANKSVNEIEVADYDFLIIPGGVKAMEKLRLEKNAVEFIKKWDEQKKPIACICSGAQMLITARITKGRKITGFYSIQVDIENSGATFVDAPFVTDGNIVTSPHYKYMGPWMKEALRIYYSKS
jgi:protease I